MITFEKVAWVVIILGLIAGVSLAIVRPTYDKAKDLQKEIEDIDFSTSYNMNLEERVAGILYGDIRKA